MAASGSGRISFSSFASLSRGATAGASGRRNLDFLKFSNGEFMAGKKLKRLELHQPRRRCNNDDNNNKISRVNGKIVSVISEVEAQLKELDYESKDPKTVLAIILGGGAGTRLFPLTKRRAKPAVPIGGAYRLIDVPMSNCINSGINKIYILTQFNSCSLNRHISRSYSPGGVLTFGDGYVEVLAATQVPGQEGQSWFQGTADAVRQFHWLFEDPRARNIEDVLILSGDHLYRMNYMDLIQVHRESKADITLSCLPVDESRASDFGLMKTDKKGRVISFSEKPKGEDLKAMQVDTTLLGLSREEAEKKPYIASMGVYVFKKDLLLNLLRWRFPTANDFGSEVIHACASECCIKIVDSIVSHGCFLTNSFIEHSVVGIRSRINSNVHLKDTVMLGADYFETEAEVAKLLAEGKVPVGIGENTKIKDCIIDKNARIGKNVIIANSEGVQEADRSSEGFYIRSGITIVSKNSVIKDGFMI
ncbi:glucose-1-phosphate adenylyltransferase large subunit 1, chloroplastic isoform X2 [Arachis ipaensis]|uniref:glucose-1-phosphate adenylyltransferase large subunit 1, chloroplastic isoform X2 n=1 Tax=Arachis ipaensis TaxID=130454 RepID=UPI0007AFD038|nr:glucose-1-phosphate adenylyltransferase large subunit 1, chloroplastic isoform X2 [Arachis ipaensis]